MSGGAPTWAAVQLRRAMIERGFVGEDGEPAKRTLARAMASRFGGHVDSWRVQVSRVLSGDTRYPTAETSARFAKQLKQPASFLLTERNQQTTVTAPVGATIQRMIEAQARGEDPSRYAADLAAQLESIRELLEAAERALDRLARAGRSSSR